MLRLSLFWVTVLALSSSAAGADCIYDGKAYTRGAVFCVPNTLMSLTCVESQPPSLDWAKTETDPHCIPGACVNNGEVYSPGGVYTRKDVSIRCEGGKWVPN